MRILLFFISLVLFSHDERLDKKKIYKLPSEVISVENKNKLIAETENLSQQNADILSTLAEYYSQFIEDKRIEAIREKGIPYKDKTSEVTKDYKNQMGTFPIPSDVNSIRIFGDNIRKSNNESYTTRDSEILFALQKKLAENFAKLGDKNKSKEAYLQALRYRNFSVVEDRFFKEEVLQELESEKVEQIQNHKATKETFEKNKSELKRIKDEYYKVHSDYAKKNSTEADSNEKLKTFKENILYLEDAVKVSEKNYNESYNKNFKVYVENKNMEDSKFVLNFAKLVYEVENENKNLYKIEKKSGELKSGIFIDVDNSKNRNFDSYSEWLRFAIRLNPKNAEAIFLLAEELKTSGKRKESIEMYLKYLSLDKKDNLFKVYRSLASLYTEEKKNVLASYYYDLISKSITKEDTLKNDPYLYFQMSNFYSEKIGDLEKSKINSEIILEYIKNKRTQEEEIRKKDDKFGVSLYEIVRRLKTEFICNFYIANYYHKNKYPDKELIHLENAYLANKSLDEYIKQYKDLFASAKTDFDNLKKSLLGSTSSYDLERFKEEQDRLDDIKNDLNFLLIESGALRKVALMNRMILIEEENRNYKRVKNLYQEIILIGNQDEASIAIRNYERIKKIEADGYNRKKLF